MIKPEKQSATSSDDKVLLFSFCWSFFVVVVGHLTWIFTNSIPSLLRCRSELKRKWWETQRPRPLAVVWPSPAATSLLSLCDQGTSSTSLPKNRDALGKPFWDKACDWLFLRQFSPYLGKSWYKLQSYKLRYTWKSNQANWLFQLKLGILLNNKLLKNPWEVPGTRLRVSWSRFLVSVLRSAASCEASTLSENLPRFWL